MTKPRLVSTPDGPAVLDPDAGDLGLGVDLDAAPGGAAGVAPGDRVVPRDRARRVVEGGQDRVADLVGQVELRAEPPDVVGPDQAGIDAQMLVDLGPPAGGAHGGVGVGEGQVAAGRVEDVEVEVGRQVLKQPHRLVVEAHALGRQVVRADDRGVARGVAAGEPAALQHGHARDAVVAGEIVGGGEPVPAAADDHHVVGRAQLGAGREEALGRVLAREAVAEQFEGHRGKLLRRVGEGEWPVRGVLPHRPTA